MAAEHPPPTVPQTTGYCFVLAATSHDIFVCVRFRQKPSRKLNIARGLKPLISVHGHSEECLSVTQGDYTLEDHHCAERCLYPGLQPVGLALGRSCYVSQRAKFQLCRLVTYVFKSSVCRLNLLSAYFRLAWLEHMHIVCPFRRHKH